MKRILFGLAALAAGVATAATELSVSARQNWPWDGKVLIDLEMPTGTNDLSLVATFDCDGRHHEIELDKGNGLSGESFSLTGGRHQLEWDPVAGGYSGAIKDLSVVAKAVPADERAWLVIDTVTGDYEYLPLDAAPTDANGKLWQDRVYMYRKMVFRRIPAGRATIGYTQEQINYLKSLPNAGSSSLIGAHEVELTSDYYITIYQVTQGQALRILDPTDTNTSTGGFHGRRGSDTQSLIGAGYICYQRGSNNVEGINWPATKFRVTPDSHIGRFRSRCRNRFMIDLPTLAQWQRAARPDPQWIWYDTPDYGGGTVGDSLETVTNVLDTIAWGVPNLRKGTKSYNPPNVPGQYQPNAFGLCDLTMSRPELLLDYWKSGDFLLTETLDPVGPEKSSYLDRRVCCNSFQATMTFTAYALASTVNYGNDMPPNADSEICYRYVIHLRPPQSFNGQWE